MILIRRLWLAPAFFIALCIYYFFYRQPVPQEYHYDLSYSIHLDPQQYKTRHPVLTHLKLPPDPAKDLPRIQYDFSTASETPEAKQIRLDRLSAVKASFDHAWKGYRKHAWRKDEVSPLSGNWRNSFGGWGATLVDTMDTLWMMDMKKDFEDCVAAVEKIDFSTNTEESLNVFETTIRYLGGLLAAYDLSEGKYPVLLKKAKELGEILYLSFDTPNHMPVTRWDWRRTALGQMLGSASDKTLIAELGSLTLEFTRLSQLTGDTKYYDVVQRIALIMAEQQDKTKVPGLWPTIVNARDLRFDYNHFTLGGMVDSAYEYLPKQFMLLGGLDDTFKTMYEKAIAQAKRRLFFRPFTPQNADILFSGNAGLNAGETVTELNSQHLTCFVGGMMGIAAKIFSTPEDLEVARKLVDGCIWAYNSTPSGLMPEVFNIAHCHVGVTPDPISNIDISRGDCDWSEEKYYEAVARQQPYEEVVAGMSPGGAGRYWKDQKNLLSPYTDNPDNRYILRPEAIESIFILYRVTGDPTLLESAWTMFQSIERITRTPIAHAGVWDVRHADPVKMDRMESFWLAETLKYFYLIFADPDLVSLDEYVLNTEAHPLRRPRPGSMLVSS